jgi:hypothetical protein
VVRPGKIAVIKERYHVHVDTVEEACLVDGHVDGMVSGLEQEIGLFRGFDPYGQEDGTAAGCADTEIAAPFPDIIDHFGNDGDFTQAGTVTGAGEHVASIIGSRN